MNRICPQCGKEIPADMVQQGGLHLHCSEVDIDVFFVSLPDAPKIGFYEKDPAEIMAMLAGSEDAYLIERQVMKAGQYYNLPDFDGF